MTTIETILRGNQYSCRAKEIDVSTMKTIVSQRQHKQLFRGTNIVPRQGRQ